jgi:hypothetical protein
MLIFFTLNKFENFTIIDTIFFLKMHGKLLLPDFY